MIVDKMTRLELMKLIRIDGDSAIKKIKMEVDTKN